jgi:peptidoglycan/xylan/chitin deacetylase (PgdA/CDA1 family)
MSHPETGLAVASVASNARGMRRIAGILLCVTSLAVGTLGCTTETTPAGKKANRLPTTRKSDPAAEADKFWQNARKEVDKSVLELLAQHQAELEAGIRFRKLIRGDPTKKQVAVTFDDGPHPAYTPKLLDVLKRYNARATFFVVGEMAEKYPELVKAEVAAGHSVGNHTYHHVNLTKIPEEYVATEIKACGEVVKAITGRAPHLFRPPGGDYDRPVAEVAEALGYSMVLWTDDPGDYASPGEQVIESRVLGRIGNGGIVLIHDGIQETVDALPRILSFLRERDYQLVTIDSMMERD